MKESLLSIKLNTYRYNEFLNQTMKLVSQEKSAYICVANTHMLVEAYKDTSFASVVNEADLCAVDGMPLVWGMKLLNGVSHDRVCGMELLPDLLEQAEIKNYPVFFYGGTQEMLDSTRNYIKEKYSKLIIGGLHSPPFRPLTETEDTEIVHMINSSGAKLLLVALGCPKQEKWMASMKGRIKITMIGIGGALPVMVGLQSRAPKWLQQAGLEWLYRLIQEPKRLFRRYATTNSIFIALFLKAWLNRKIFANRLTTGKTIRHNL